MNKTTDRPSVVTDEMLDFLDGLRESGATNMYGAGPYLEDEFPELREGHSGRLSSKATQSVLAYWMDTFKARN